MGGQPDAPFRHRQAHGRPVRTVEKGIVLRHRRPDVLVEAAEDLHVGGHQTRFQKAQYGKPRVAGMGRAHGPRRQFGDDEGRIVARRHLRCRSGMVQQLADAERESLAGLFQPQFADARGIGGNGFRCAQMRAQQPLQRPGAGRGEDGGQIAQILRQPLRQRPHVVPVLRRHLPHRPVPVPRIESGIPAAPTYHFGQFIDARESRQIAQHRRLQPGEAAEEVTAAQTETAERMGGQRRQRCRREPGKRGFRQQFQKHARRRVGQRQAGGIVHLDIPPGQLRPHLTGQRAVRRDEGGRLPRRLQHMAHQQRDTRRLLLAMLRMDVPHAPRPGHQPLLVPVDHRPPFAGSLRRSHGFRQQKGAIRSPVPPFHARQILDLASVRIHDAQQARQAVLRVAFRKIAPAFLVHVPIEAREYDAPRRQPGNLRQQCCGGRNAAGGSRRDHRTGWRRLPVEFGTGADQPGPAGGGAHHPHALQFLRIAHPHVFQQITGRQPMLRPLGGEQPMKASEFHLLVLETVDERGQRTGHLHRLSGMFADDPGQRPCIVGFRPFADDPGQQKTAGQRRYRRWQVLQQLLPGRHLGQSDLILVHVAERMDAGQHLALRRCRLQQGCGQLARRAPVRQEDRPVGEIGGAGATISDGKGAGEHGPGQGRQERHVRRYRIKSGPSPLAHALPSVFRAAIASSASLTAPGVPTCSQRPSWERAYIRPASMATSNSRFMENGPSGASWNRRG